VTAIWGLQGCFSGLEKSIPLPSLQFSRCLTLAVILWVTHPRSRQFRARCNPSIKGGSRLCSSEQGKVSTNEPPAGGLSEVGWRVYVCEAMKMIPSILGAYFLALIPVLGGVRYVTHNVAATGDWGSHRCNTKIS
jgi:hypothetical protein